jgi:hypothetical protein
LNVADVEVDDIDFGVEKSLDPAGTEKADERTDGATDYDPEDLDSEDDELDKELGIEAEDTENEGELEAGRTGSCLTDLISSPARRSALLSFTPRETNAGLPTAAAWHSTSGRRDECCGDVAYYPRDTLRGGLRSCQRGEILERRFESLQIRLIPIFRDNTIP